MLQLHLDRSPGLSLNGVMARPIRVEYPGAVYHVMARGNHDPGRAERMVGWGLRKLGMGTRELEAPPKGQIEKHVLAWWPHGRTTATRRWIAEELRMGYESRLSRAVSWVEASRARNVVEVKRD
jgi:hypothetical protein